MGEEFNVTPHCQCRPDNPNAAGQRSGKSRHQQLQGMLLGRMWEHLNAILLKVHLPVRRSGPHVPWTHRSQQPKWRLDPFSCFDRAHRHEDHDTGNIWGEFKAPHCQPRIFFLA